MQSLAWLKWYGRLITTLNEYSLFLIDSIHSVLLSDEMWATNWDTGFFVFRLCSPFFLDNSKETHTHINTHTYARTESYTPSSSTKQIWILFHSYVMLIYCSIWPLNKDTIFIPLPEWLPAWQSLYTDSRASVESKQCFEWNHHGWPIHTNAHRNNDGIALVSLLTLCAPP